MTRAIPTSTTHTRTPHADAASTQIPAATSTPTIGSSSRSDTAISQLYGAGPLVPFKPSGHRRLPAQRILP